MIGSKVEWQDEELGNLCGTVVRMSRGGYHVAVEMREGTLTVPAQLVEIVRKAATYADYVQQGGD